MRGTERPMSPLAAIVAMIALAAPTSLATAQQVRGVVTDTIGRPLAEAVVILPEVQRRTRTDSLGRFALESSRPGRQTLRVLLIGYRMNESRVTLSEDAPAEVRIALRATRRMLDTVRVVDVEGCAPNTIRGFECRRAGDRRGIATRLRYGRCARTPGPTCSTACPACAAYRS
jgi:hypothetical protein